MTADRVYRITLRMDDGSTQVVTQDTTPDFRSGDRVNLSGGAIRR
jgi:outer membrane lipoprotein SlyB